ncbi:MAG: DUF2303 family protein [Ilumatobacter sp.]|nr:DUF2303 family protein [Ilumatobacter sp.]
MSDDTTTNLDTDASVLATAQLLDRPAGGLRTLVSAEQFIEQSIEHALVATDPVDVGDFGMAFRKPDGAVEIIDLNQWLYERPKPTFITDRAKFVSVDSLARYVERYAVEESTVAYISDTYGKGIKLLTSDNDVAWITIDDHPLFGFDGTMDQPVGRQAHTASLVLRPTEAGKRWGQALSAAHLSQEQFLDLVVDGIGEIAEPDGAVLRDLISDLHAIRTTEVQSVVRTGGEGSIQLAENVKLHAGQGNEVSFPETLKATFVPFVGVSDAVVLTVRIKPAVGSNKVVFSLSCAQLEDQLAHVVGTIAATIAEHTSLNPLWKP